jgi:diguanylate cyclase (GGDEF)-like protein/PAS domain S-box-containing protein
VAPDDALIREVASAVGAQVTSGELIALGIDEIPGAAVLVFDRDMRYHLVRGEAVRVNGVRPEDLEGQVAASVLPAERWANLESSYLRALSGGTATREVESPDGQRRYLVRTAALRRATGEVVGGVSVASDVTEVRRVERARAASEQRTKLAFESAPTGMALESLEGRFLEVNPALCQMLDRSTSWLLAHTTLDVLGEGEVAPDLIMRDRVASQLLESASGEKRLVRADGTALWVLHSIGLLTDDRGAPQQFLSHYVDISLARESRERLQHMATHDPTTGLLNREGFWQRLRTITGHPARGGARLAVLYLDLDDFKVVNDTLGHSTGDRVLAEVGLRIQSALRGDDPVARVGGDEFVVLLTSLREPAEARTVADQLLQRVRQPMHVGGEVLRVDMSVGIAILNPDDSADAALHRADLAMYQAKRGGGGRAVLAAQ